MTIQYARQKTGNPSVQPVIWPWQSYTPTWTATSVNPAIGNGTINGKYRRVGDSVEVLITLTAGASTTAGTGDYYFGLPTGLSIDFAKIPSGSFSAIVGNAAFERTSNRTNNLELVVLLNTGSATAVSLYNMDGVLSVFGSASNFDTSSKVVMHFTVPVVGWDTHTAYGAGMSSLVTPGLVYQSDEIDIAAQVSCAQAGFSINGAIAVVRKDKNNKCEIDFNITADFTSASLTGLSLTLAGVKFRNVTGFYQSCTAAYKTSSVFARCLCTPNSGTIAILSASTTADGICISGRAYIDAKPSWA